MGTNYYLEAEKCACCGQELPNKPRRHIGKSSAGWVFGLHIIPEDGINDLFDWIALWDAPGAKIVDEYGHSVTPYEMLKCIVNRRREPIQNDKFDHQANGSEQTFNGLIRAKPSRYFDEPGHATWNRCKGGYS